MSGFRDSCRAIRKSKIDLINRYLRGEVYVAGYLFPARTNLAYLHLPDIRGFMDKDLTLVKTQASKAIVAANGLEIKVADDLVVATDILGKIKKVYNLVKERMEAPVKRAYQAYKDIKAEQEKTFGVFIKNCEEAEITVKTKMLAYKTAMDKRAEVKEEKIMAKVEAGDMSWDKAADKIDKITPVNQVEAKSGAVQFKTVKKVVISDPEVETVIKGEGLNKKVKYYKTEKSIIPDQYWELDLVKVRESALSGVNIPGVSVIEEQTVSGYVR